VSQQLFKPLCWLLIGQNTEKTETKKSAQKPALGFNEQKLYFIFVFNLCYFNDPGCIYNTYTCLPRRRLGSERQITDFRIKINLLEEADTDADAV